MLGEWEEGIGNGSLGGGCEASIGGSWLCVLGFINAAAAACSAEGSAMIVSYIVVSLTELLGILCAPDSPDGSSFLNTNEGALDDLHEPSGSSSANVFCDSCSPPADPDSERSLFPPVSPSTMLLLESSIPATVGRWSIAERNGDP